MIDAATGALTLDGLAKIAPELRRPEFLWSGLGRKARVLVSNPPYCSYILPKVAVEGRTFAATLWFNEDALESVSLVDAGDEFDQPFSAATEQARHAAHQGHLKRWLPSTEGGEFSWGAARAVLDPKGGEAAIWIRYRKPDTPQ